jgi:hypothetical protein
MLYDIYKPAPELSNWVRHYWFIQFEAESEATSQFTLMADGYPNLIFQYQNSFIDPQTFHSFPSLLLNGHTIHPRLLLNKGSYRLCGIAFFPQAMISLFDLKGSEVSNAVVSADFLPASTQYFLNEKIVLAKNDLERVKNF